MNPICDDSPMTQPKPPKGTLSELFSLLKPFWPILAVSITLGIMGGLSITALLATINQSLHADGPAAGTLLLAFGGLCSLALLGSIFSDIGTNHVGQHVIAKLRKDLGSKILSAPIEQIERYKSHRLIPVLTHDVDVISDFAFAFSPLAVSLTVTLGCMGYLAHLSLPMFICTVVAILLGTTAQYFARLKGIRGFFEAREAEDDLQKHYRAISEGAKELRIHRPRRFRVYRDHLQKTVEKICDIQLRSIKLFVVAKTFGSTLFFIVIGVVLVYQSLYPNTDKATLSGFILVLLFMKGPLEHLIGNLPIVSRAQVSFRRIADLSAQFASPEPHLLLEGTVKPATPLQSIELRDARYTFPTVEGVTPFTLGPVNLRLNAGEIMFIAGENGAGKTTLIKVLLGLYAPQQGSILLDGKEVGVENRDDYRQLFTTIFADYFLFDDLMGDEKLPDEAHQYLDRLEISHKVSIQDGNFTTTDLSTGQRKRLALVQAWLDHRPVLVFDEWAADQDPAFRRIFYTELLPDLQRLGKTIIVISHDDRYFHIADRLVRMEPGRIYEDVRQQHPVEA